jgi:hypothetical protein
MTHQLVYLVSRAVLVLIPAVFERGKLAIC